MSYSPELRRSGEILLLVLALFLLAELSETPCFFTCLAPKVAGDLNKS